LLFGKQTDYQVILFYLFNDDHASAINQQLLILNLT